MAKNISKRTPNLHMGLVTRPGGGGGHYSREGFIFHWLLETRALFEMGHYSREGSNRVSTVFPYKVYLCDVTRMGKL